MKILSSKLLNFYKFRASNSTSLHLLKFKYSEKATKFCEISTADLTVTTYEKSTVEISQSFVAFSEYLNFTVDINFTVDLVLTIE